MKKTLFFIFLFFYSTIICAQVPFQSTDVMLQTFSWNSYSTSNWNTLKSQSQEIADYFDAVWLPPSGKHGGVSWNEQAMGYLPLYYFNQNSSFGTQNELKLLIAELTLKGVKSIADIVVNHRVGETNWINFPSETYKGVTYTWGLNTICSNDKITDCNTSCATGYIGEPSGSPDTGDAYHAARDIDHTNLTVQNTIKAYLDFMKNEIGYQGWRYDYVKGFGGEYVQIYNNSAAADLSVGECYDFSYDVVSSWIEATNHTSMAFDFPLKNQLNKVFNQGASYTELSWLSYANPQPAGLIHNDNRRYAVTFVDNHDTGRTDGGDGSCPLTGNVLAAYAYILTQPGIPCVWWEHWNNLNYKLEIKKMVNARKAVQVHSQSEVVVNQVNQNAYVATITGKNGNLMLKLGAADFTPTSDYDLVTSGTNFEVWQNILISNNKQQEKVPQVSFYPNPVKDKLKIFSSEEIKKVRIFDVQGAEVISSSFQTQVDEFDVSALKKGFYIIQLSFYDASVYTQIFIKE